MKIFISIKINVYMPVFMCIDKYTEKESQTNKDL